MLSNVELFFEENDYEMKREERITMRRLRRSIRDNSNPLELPEHLFILYFRLNKDAFMHVLSEIGDTIQSTSSSATPPFIKLLCTLRFLGSGSYQNCVGSDFDLGLSQPTVSIILNEVLRALETKLCPVWIKTEMTQTKKQDARTYFYRRSRLPGIVGCVDGTHIGIIAPDQLQHQYLNRKGFYSLNAMIACDHNMNIRYVDPRFPGSTHDSFVWNASELKDVLERWWRNGERSMYLGDSGYPLQPYLLTPFRNSDSNPRKTLFNSLHAKARNIIERTIGLLKSRFRSVLNERKLHYSPAKATIILNVACALHNITRRYNVADPETTGIEIISLQDTPDETFQNEVSNNSQEAQRIRNEILASI